MAKPKGNEDEINIVEERDEFMVSVRTTHFLKPTLSPINDQIPELLPLPHSSLPYTFHPYEWHLKVKIQGSMKPNSDLIFWVDIKRPKYQDVWEKTCIFEAIMTSTYSIKRYSDLVFVLAEKWDPETHTYIFPWAEATISLEGVIILGGYSVIGFPVASSCDTQQLKEAEAKLVAECGKIKGVKWRRITIRELRDYFIGSGRDIEHEAFLTRWLTRFVFLDSNEVIKDKLFPIACRLAKGLDFVERNHFWCC